MTFSTSYGSKPQTYNIFIVADGMGGHNKGEIASKFATSLVASSFIEKTLAIDNPLIALKDSILETNERVYNYAQEYPQCREMGTTITAVVVNKGQLFVGHVGDTRAYIINENGIEQITKDHSVVQEMLDRGEITKAEARLHHARNVITRALGYQPRLEVDTLERNLYREDRIVLCSDGLTSSVDDEEIKDVILKNSDLQKACEELVSLANNRGGHDNISIILVQFDELPSRQEILSAKTHILQKVSFV